MLRSVRFSPSLATVLALLALIVAVASSVRGITAEEGDEAPAAAGRTRPSTMSVASAEWPLPRNDVVVHIVACSPGYKVISGGAQIKDTASAYLTMSTPGVQNRTGRQGWAAMAVNPPSLTGESGVLKIYAICAREGVPFVP